jgi:hypothetical protein
VRRSRFDRDYRIRLDQCVAHYIDENGLDDLQRSAKLFDVSASALRRSVININNNMGLYRRLMRYNVHFRHVLKLREAPHAIEGNPVLLPPNNSTIDNIVEGLDTPNKGGRRKLVSDAIIEKITKINHEKNLAGDSMSSRAIIKLIERERFLELPEGSNADSLRPLSKSAGLKAVALIAPVYIQNPDIQNKRRLEAKGDMYNQVSLASVATAILRHPNLDGLSEYRRQNIHCVDAMSVYLFDKNSQGVRVGKTVRKDMKRKSRSISKTMNQPQSRTVKCYFDCNAEGNLDIVVISITDRLFTEKRKWIRINQNKHTYELWVLLLNKAPQEKKTTAHDNNESNKENVASNENKNRNKKSKHNNIEEEKEEVEDNEDEYDEDEDIEEEQKLMKNLMKNKNYQEPLTVNDTRIMAEMLETILIPKLIRTRKIYMEDLPVTYSTPSEKNNHNSNANNNQSNGANNKRESLEPDEAKDPDATDLSRIPPPILLFLDGDHPQVTALVNGILDIFEDDNISIIKCPGGTSGTCQPNDLMKAHMIFRQATTTGAYWDNFLENNYELPEYWESHLLPYFKSSGVSAASQDTYGYFFSTLSQLIHKSFSEEIVRRGKLYLLTHFFFFYFLSFYFILFFCFYFYCNTLLTVLLHIVPLFAILQLLFPYYFFFF